MYLLHINAWYRPLGPSSIGIDRAQRPCLGRYGAALYYATGYRSLEAQGREIVSHLPSAATLHCCEAMLLQNASVSLGGWPSLLPLCLFTPEALLRPYHP